MRYLFLLVVLIGFVSCKDDVIVKPSAMMRLEYPDPVYKLIEPDCPYGFEKNDQASLQLKKNCWMNLEYPEMKATVYLTYQQIRNNNLDSLLRDAQKLTYDHTIKAQSILEQPRVDSVNKVYGMFYMINGDAATQSQFYVTDSLKHFITGSLYFESKPKFDSLYPAVVYLREDIRRIMETVYWRN
ncbi:MAG: gliding motility lipoprotein GldD [Bacteroidia bacterium]|nr:gliding motility lipoprotein GldD [Bacteroidia bacterium]NNF30446.1 gliding motility lipoprotein GldD [Flavobacteriaceae bacterium]MBT8275653.1 gliding motility lipoprotein GldD [Bacteroidia bacterium]NNJ82679.1 gliding motility lipoprotein GldD [Flavobacteriaceae bacterium]NNK54296.1 gliding motility lipoprotein GldD [Flavobacteriaceae bacterium]